MCVNILRTIMVPTCPMKTTARFLLILLLFQGNASASWFQPDTYDFIIVGGGTAGCLLASRLSENSNFQVLVVEAGGEEVFIEDIPLTSPGLVITPASWGFKSQPSDQFGGATSNGVIWAQGKGLGGSSSINGMVYTRGNDKDYDHWKDLGNEGWGSDDVLPYFLKHEKMTLPEYANDTKYHSTKGELYLSRASFHTPLSASFLQAGQEKGYGIYDYNAANETSFSYLQSTVRDNARWSSNSAFLAPARKRSNLHVMKWTQITKILIDPQNKAAYGVEYLKFGLIPTHIYARKEIIVSAGAINSPKLLILSGVGPSDHLKELGIPVIQDSKVGYNLRDQILVDNMYFTVNQSVDIRLDKIFHDIFSLVQYFITRSGEFTVTFLTDAVAFLDLNKDNYPNVQLFFAGTLTPNIPFYLTSLVGNSDAYNKAFSPLWGKDGFTVEVILLRPLSVGRMKLKDKNPNSSPLLYPNFFSDEGDFAPLIAGIKFVLDLMKTEPFQKYNATFFRSSICNEHEFGTDAFWQCYIRFSSTVFLHTVGTCKMGPDSDPDAVVDSNLRLRGIKNVRVVDSSIMPTLITGNTMAPTYMIAEKGAEMIKTYWNSQ